MSGGGGGGTSSNTVTQVQQIPQFEQDYAQNNQNLAASLGTQPYPQYQGPLVQNFTQPQLQGMQMAQNSATAYQPDLATAQAYTGNGINQGAGAINSAINSNPLAQNSPANPNVISSYMSPYIQQSLAPQVTALQTQLGQQQNAINAQATQANAFGDARQGSAQALQNFYGNQALSGLEAQGYNTAYNNALQTAVGQQQLGVGEQQTQGQLGASLGNLELTGANQFANLGGLQQSLGISGANATYNSGTQQQQLGQQELNTAYQQYLNQVNWPFQMLNVQESALSNSPYNMVSATTLPNANMGAQSLGAGLGGLGSLAALFGGGGNGANTAPFGGSALQS
jgi:hypothetical protein